MAIVVEDKVAGEQDGGAGGTPLTLTLPLGAPDDGDLLIACIIGGVSGNRYPVAPTGWTEEVSVNTTYGPWYVRVFYRVASSDGASFDFDANATYSGLSGCLVRLSGAGDPSSTALVTASYEDSDAYNAGTVTCPGVTVTNDGSLSILFTAASRDDASVTPPSGYAEQAYDGSGTVATDTHVATKAVDSGAFAGQDWTNFHNWWSLANTAVCGVTVVASPAAAGGGATIPRFLSSIESPYGAVVGQAGIL